MAALTGAASFAQRARRRVIAHDARTFERYALVLVIAMFLNIASGAFVRLTGSGLGCPDWPLCKGQPVPPFNYHPVIEFSNRAIALAGILAALLTYLSARQVGDRMARRLAAGVALLTFGQIPLGAVTVLFDLNPVLVMNHFLVAVVATGLAAMLLARMAAGAATRRAVRSRLAGPRQRARGLRADRERRVLHGGGAARRRRGHPPHGQPAGRDLRARARRDDLHHHRGAAAARAAVRQLAARSLAGPRARADHPAAAAGLHRRVPVAQPAALVGRAGARLGRGGGVDRLRLARDPRGRARRA